MTQSFEDMLYLFGAGALGGDVAIEHNIDVEEIRRLAVEQGVWTIVYTPLSKMCNTEKHQAEFWGVISKGISRNEFTLNTIEQLEKEGIEVCLLKGATVSRLYKEPDCRISGDTDILIKREDLDKAVSVLEKCGYKMEEYLRNSHHFKARHPIGGLLEIHISLYRNTDEQIVFNGMGLYSEEYIDININGHNVKTLGINDGLIYLTAHYIKHLVKKGSGIRQIMDLLLYVREYEREIDYEKYNKVLKELRYDKLIDVVKSIGAKYFGMNYSLCDENIMNKVLEDMEIGGVFGYGAEARSDFYERYCERRTEMSWYGFKKYFESEEERSIADKLFPKQEVLLEMGYKYALHRCMIPIAWVNRYFDLIVRRHREATNDKSKTEINERLKLMRDLNMID